MAKKEEWVTPNHFSKEISVTPQAVLNAIESGRFSEKCLRTTETKTGKKRYKILLKEGLVEFEENKQIAQKNYSDQDFTQARRQEQVAKARIAELECLEREGELVRVEEVVKHHTKLATQLVTGADNLITRIAPELLNINSPLEMEKLLRTHFMGYFEEFSRGCEQGNCPYS